jgi:dTDP-4-dehydrorhamnose reductase
VTVRVVVTGAQGRLGRALLAALGGAPAATTVVAWSRPEYDLDAPAAAERLLDRDRPDVVVHAAAWTDVDGCARAPELATARNGAAVDILARACVARRIGLVLVSTNEVFDGRRTDGRGYAVDDPPNPINPYGASKLAGEVAALRAYGLSVAWQDRAAGHGRPAVVSPRPGLAIVRTAWLFGPPGNDFPSKIVAAAKAAAARGQSLRVVADEVGSPTYATDLARAIVALLPLVAAGAGGQPAGPIWHLVNAGRVSRADWAREVLRLVGLDVPVVDIPATDWLRASTPPRWAVLEPGVLPPALVMRSWREALAEYLAGGPTGGLAGGPTGGLAGRRGR